MDVERLDADVGQQVSFDEVLLIDDQEMIHLGKPTLDGARVVGTIAEQGKMDKVVVFKFKRRKMYRRKQGHRQLFTRVRVDQIELTPGLGPKRESKKTAKAAKKSAKKPKAKPGAGPTKEAKQAVAKEASQMTVKKKVAKRTAGKKSMKASKKQAAKGLKKTTAKASKKKGAGASQKLASKKTAKRAKKKSEK
ncbi:50S ribosomal protein L21 [Acidobacteria bacterium AH-259-A15]|nr:50S ribosomal protein L21 [Acidobacteria bacterium AH-259-A15]